MTSVRAAFPPPSAQREAATATTDPPKAARALDVGECPEPDTHFVHAETPGEQRYPCVTQLWTRRTLS